MLHVLISRRWPEIAAVRQYVGRKAQRGDTIRKHIGSMSSEAARGRAATDRALPNAVRDLLDAQQRLDRDARRLVQVEAALGVWVPLDLAGVEHSLRATPPQLGERVPRACQAEHVAELAAAKLHAVHFRPAFIGDNAGGDAGHGGGRRGDRGGGRRGCGAAPLRGAPGRSTGHVSNAPFMPPAELQLCWGFPFSGQRFVGEAPAPRHLAHRDAPGQPGTALREWPIFPAAQHDVGQALTLVARGRAAVDATEHKRAEFGVGD